MTFVAVILFALTLLAAAVVRAWRRPPRTPLPHRHLVAAGTLALLGAGGLVAEPRAYAVQSGSMEPTYEIGDRVLATRGEIRRGSAVLFSGDGDSFLRGRVFLKRVIGLPGETIEARAGRVRVNGTEISEPWLPDGTTTADFGPVTVSADGYFVLGDDRDQSADSRHNGPVPNTAVLGVVRLTWLPAGGLIG